MLTAPCEHSRRTCRCCCRALPHSLDRCAFSAAWPTGAGRGMAARAPTCAALRSTVHSQQVMAATAVPHSCSTLPAAALTNPSTRLQPSWAWGSRSQSLQGSESGCLLHQQALSCWEHGTRSSAAHHAANHRAAAAVLSQQVPRCLLTMGVLPTPPRRAMGGSVSFQDALAARLGVMQPSRDDMRRFLEQHPPQVGPVCGSSRRMLQDGAGCPVCHILTLPSISFPGCRSVRASRSWCSC